MASSSWATGHQYMIIPSIGIVSTGTVAIAKIDLLRMHAAELHVAPAIGEFFDCKCWRNEAESVFFGNWADVERAHVMLVAVRSTMNESSQISSRLVQAGKIRKLWRQAFPRAWDIGSVSACDGSRLDGPLPSSGKARSLLRDLPTCFEG